MKVKQLINKLKKMPQNCEVAVSMHDNSEWETAGDVSSVLHFIKSDFADREFVGEDERAFDDMPKECVILHC